MLRPYRRPTSQGTAKCDLWISRSVRGGVPVRAAADLHVEWDTEVDGAGHPGPDQRLEGVPLTRGDLEDELVVHLQQHPRLEALVDDVSGDAEHRDLHDVGRRALDGRVQGLTLGVLTQDAVGRRQVG